MSLLNIWDSFIAHLPENFQGIFIAGNNTGNNELTSLEGFPAIYWITFFILLSLAFVLVLCKSNVIEKLSKHILSMSLLVWFIGVIVYIIGFYSLGVNGLSVILRAIISSFKMFVVSNDLARVSKFLQSDAIYMTVFSILHFAAAFITFLFIFKMVGYKIKSSLNIIIHKLFHTNDYNVHLFWEVNEASCLLAKDIRKNTPDATIIFVDIDKESEENTQKKTTLSNITNTITIRNSEIARLDAINALVDHCYNGPSALTECDDIFGVLHLKNIGEIIRKSNRAFFYFLSDNEKQNISGALNLQHDRILNEINGRKPLIYVHAHRDANNEVLDHYSQYDSQSKRTEIKVIDSAYLSIATLKNDDRALPVNCIEVDKDKGVVDSPFTSLIIGFGGTGQEAFRFLYEYSAFASSNGKRSPFKCYAIDEKMDKIAGLVRMKMPAIGEDKLSLIKASIDSDTYWEKIKEIISELNYVVIAINDDALGLSIAVNLFKYAIRNRTEKSPRMKIMIRCYDNANEKRMSEVATNLNKSIGNDDVEIMLYGREKDLYCCKNILSDTTLQKAKLFHCEYEESDENPDTLWKKSFGDEKINDMINKGMSRYHAIYDINRRIAQNICNSLHCRTKLILMGLDEDETKERLNRLMELTRQRKKETICYGSPSPEAELLINMAITEHERWIASHELMGYTKNSKNDHVKKHHECMVDWRDLKDDNTRSYDCNVVDTTIRMAYEKKQNK